MTFSFETIMDAVVQEQRWQFETTRIWPFGDFISPNVVLGRYRDRSAVMARCAVAQLCYRHLRQGNFCLIGRLLGLDHTTVIHLIKRSRPSSNLRVITFVQAVEARLNRLADARQPWATATRTAHAGAAH